MGHGWGRERVNDFTVKDSGKREQLAGGMVRDTEEGKADYSLIYDGPMLDRWAEHLTKGAKKYEARNWMKAGTSNDVKEMRRTQERFKRSALRHMRQWLRGDRDEDHAAAVFFNLNGYEYLQECLWGSDIASPLTDGPTEPRRSEDRYQFTHKHLGEVGFHSHPVLDSTEDHDRQHTTLEVP